LQIVHGEFKENIVTLSIKADDNNKTESQTDFHGEEKESVAMLTLNTNDNTNEIKALKSMGYQRKH